MFCPPLLEGREPHSWTHTLPRLTPKGTRRKDSRLLLLVLLPMALMLHVALLCRGPHPRQWRHHRRHHRQDGNGPLVWQLRLLLLLLWLLPGEGVCAHTS
jgi:hypothetical protein